MKIIAWDFDGTLFQEDGTGISQADRDAISKFRTQGGIFGIVTGRDLTACAFVLKNLPNTLDFLICSTGALICDGMGNILSSSKSNEAIAISDIADFSLKNNVTNFIVIDEKVRHPLDVSGKEAHNFKSLKEFNNCTIWFETVENAKVVEKYIKDNFDECLTFFRNYQCIEITPKGVTKASGIRELINRYVSPEVYAIGDGATDASMVTEFFGFAVSNANPDLKKVAKHQCNRVSDMIDFVLKN